MVDVAFEGCLWIVRVVDRVEWMVRRGHQLVKKESGKVGDVLIAERER
jgi:hypothetical protein